jgi:hypothetical protein
VRNERFAARPTTYKGIQMRSRLEADFARFLDEERAALSRFTSQRPYWQYESCCFASERGQYLPDFLVVNGPRRTFIEVKPESVTGQQLLAALAAMEIMWDSEPDAHLRLVVWTYKAERPPIELDCERTWAEWRLMVKGYDDFPWPEDLSARAAEETIRSFLHTATRRVLQSETVRCAAGSLPACGERTAGLASCGHFKPWPSARPPSSRRSSGSGRRTPTPGTRDARKRYAPRRVTETRWLGGSPCTTRGMHET